MKTSVSLGNHACMMVPARVREDLRQFYVDTLGGTIMQADPNRDFIRIGDNFFMAFLYGNVEDISEIHRSAARSGSNSNRIRSPKPAKRSRNLA